MKRETQPGENTPTNQSATQPAVQPRQRPSLGRIVHYCWGDGPVCYPKKAAAIITHVHDDDAVDLHVFFNVDRDGMLCDGRFRVTDEPTRKANGVTAWWTWPPRD